MRITLAQLNPTIGDIEGNVAAMAAAAAEAQAQGARLVVFPELSLTGYNPADLLLEVGFVDRIEQGLADLRQASCHWPQLAWVIGAPVARKEPGKPFYNQLLVVQNGQVLLDYAKQLLPTYDVFDEHRHFEPGPDLGQTLVLDGLRIGFLVCEDGWNDDGQDYAVNPFQRLAAAGPDLLIAINASPSNLGKRAIRHGILGKAVARHGLPLLWVNQVGGQDQLVYDGASFAMEPERGLVFEAPHFAEAVLTLAFDQGHFCAADAGPLPPLAAPLPTMEFYRQQIDLGLKDYARRCGFTKVVVGCSGGIDSALTLALAAETLGAENVLAVTMPSAFSSVGSVLDSRELCHNLGIRLVEAPIHPLVDAYRATFTQAFGDPPRGLAQENLQARIRGALVMACSNAQGQLVLTTGNKSELSVGYFTLYGDSCGGLNLIGDLYKTEVFELCRHLNARAGRPLIPQAIIDKAPSAELAPDQKDTDSLPPYDVLDEILKYYLEGPRLPPAEYQAMMAAVVAHQATAQGRALLQRIRRLMANSEYKRRQAAPIIRVRARAFGSGRQVPVAARHF